MKRYCECGCGGEIVKNKWTNKYAKFIRAHNNIMWKGFKLEDRHGEEKAQKIKNKQSKSYEERFGFKIAKEMRKKQSRTLEEKFGKQKAINMKKNMSKAKKGNLPWNKGKKVGSLLKNYGEKKAQEIIKKRTKPFDINVLKQTLENVFKYENNVTKGKFYKNKFVLKIGTDNTIRDKLKHKGFVLEEIANQCNLQFSRGNVTHFGNIGKNEIEILDYYAKINNVEIDKDFHVGKLKPDGAIHKQKLFIEVDEPHHPYQQIQDKIREERIKKLTGYNFIRLNEQEWLKKMENENNKTLGDF